MDFRKHGNGKSHPITPSRGMDKSLLNIGDKKAGLVLMSKEQTHSHNKLKTAIRSLVPKIQELNKLEDEWHLQRERNDYKAYIETLKSMKRLEDEIDRTIAGHKLDDAHSRKILHNEIQGHFKSFDGMVVHYGIPFESLNKKWSADQHKYLNDRNLLVRSHEDLERLKSVNADKIKKDLMNIG
jgi:hypothetical protein